MRPILNQTLRNTAMYVDYIGIPSKALMAQNVIDMGKAVLQEQQISR